MSATGATGATSAASAGTQAPILPDWTVAQVLERHPALLETFVGLYPGFARLRNPLLRALRAPRITVAQAARVAGLDSAAMVHTLNAAAGILTAHDMLVATPPARAPSPAETSQSAPPSDPAAESVAAVTIDVSDLVPPEPMLRILDALERLPAGGRLLVHHARRPVYLYPRLDTLGCSHETRDVGPGRVEILIGKP